MKDVNRGALDAQLFDKYLAGEAPEAQNAAAREWLDGNATARVLIKELQGIGIASEADYNALRARIGQRIQTRASGVLPKSKTRRHVSKYLGAGVAIAAIVFAVLNLPNRQRDASVSSAYVTGIGQQARVTLRDGSIVQLAPGSKLIANISDGRREISLTGEALFTVAPSNSSPFSVRTGNTITRVLGTSFGVRHYDNDKSVRVAVAEGKVSVGNTVLTLGDVAIADDNGTVAVQHEANLAEVLGWSSGRLAIKDLPLSDVAPILQRWYGLDIRFTDDSLEHVRLTSNMSTTARSEAVLEVLRALGLSVQRSGNKVLVRY